VDTSKLASDKKFPRHMSVEEVKANKILRIVKSKHPLARSTKKPLLTEQSFDDDRPRLLPLVSTSINVRPGARVPIDIKMDVSPNISIEVETLKDSDMVR
jgi:hypothetical protein